MFHCWINDDRNRQHELGHRALGKSSKPSLLRPRSPTVAHRTTFAIKPSLVPADKAPRPGKPSARPSGEANFFPGGKRSTSSRLDQNGHPPTCVTQVSGENQSQVCHFGCGSQVAVYHPPSMYHQRPLVWTFTLIV